MPDILKISGRCGSRIADINGVLKGNIQDVNNVVGFVAYSPPLDTYTGAAAAYSVRLLRTAYTGDCMRVRRASDSVEADIAFDAGELKLTSGVSNTSDGLSYTDFADFVDHTGTPTDAFCRYWYDQSGNANDAGQSTEPSQPQIYSATTGLITENGKPALQFDGTNDEMFTSSNISITDKTMVAVYRPTAVPAASFQDIIFGQRSADSEGNWSFLTMTSSDDCQFLGFAPANKLAASSPTFNQTQKLAEFYYNSGTGSLYRNATLLASSSSMTLQSQNAQLNIGDRFGNIENAAIKAQEILMWPSDQSSNRTGIECNINGFFKIF